MDVAETSSRVQIMNSIVDTYTLAKFEDSLQSLHKCNMVHTAGWRLQWLDCLQDENKLLHFSELSKLRSLQDQIIVVW